MGKEPKIRAVSRTTYRLPNQEEANILRALEANGFLTFGAQRDEFAIVLREKPRSRKRLLRKMDEMSGLISISTLQDGRWVCILTPHGEVVAEAIKKIEASRTS